MLPIQYERRPFAIYLSIFLILFAVFAVLVSQSGPMAFRAAGRTGGETSQASVAETLTRTRGGTPVDALDAAFSPVIAAIAALPGDTPVSASPTADGTALHLRLPASLLFGKGAQHEARAVAPIISALATASRQADVCVHAWVGAPAHAARWQAGSAAALLRRMFLAHGIPADSVAVGVRLGAEDIGIDLRYRPCSVASGGGTAGASRP